MLKENIHQVEQSNSQTADSSEGMVEAETVFISELLCST